MNKIDESAFKDYQKFEEELKYKNRFFVNSKFIESLKDAIKLNIFIVGEGTNLYGARIHKHEDKKDAPFTSKEMYNPEPEKAIRGRAIPVGISYLYLSSDINTCIKEVCPEQNDILTIGEFSLKENVNLINFIPYPIAENNYIESLNLCIRQTFSQSQISSKPEIEYLPYQFICELIKKEKYDGVMYYSGYDKNILTQSYSVVLFNPGIATLDDSKCNLIKIISTSYGYLEI